MNTINSISSRRNLDSIEVIINIRAASRAINFRNAEFTGAPRARECPLAHHHFHSRWRSRSSTSSFNFLPEDPNKNARRLRRQTRRTRGRPDARQVPVLQSFSQHPERNPFVRPQRGRWNVLRMRYRVPFDVLTIEWRIEESVKNTWIKIQPMFGHAICIPSCD